MVTKPDPVLVFLNEVTPRVGPANAVSLARDAHSSAYLALFKKLGLSEEDIATEINTQLAKMAQNIKMMPTPSPIQVNR